MVIDTDDADDMGVADPADIQKVLDKNNIILSQTNGRDVVVQVNAQGLIGNWGIRTPDEALMIDAPYEGNGVAAYSPSEIRELVDSQYIKLNIDSQNPSYPSGTYYLLMDHSSSDEAGDSVAVSDYFYNSDDFASAYNSFIKNYKLLINGQKSIHLGANDDLSSTVSKYFFGKAMDDSLTVLNQTEFDQVYDKAMQNDKGLRTNNIASYGTTAGYSVLNATTTFSNSVLLPEYDANNNVINGKYAGRLFVYAEDPITPNTRLNISYIPFDSTYVGKLNPVYLITTIGSGGETYGF